MKADANGATAERKRHAIGWKAKKDRCDEYLIRAGSKFANKCGNCKYLKAEFCHHPNVQLCTRLSAICDYYSHK
jgi:hypothetical protein